MNERDPFRKIANFFPGKGTQLMIFSSSKKFITIISLYGDLHFIPKEGLKPF
jgi:hypothetical protein